MGFGGNLEDLGVVDLLQLLNVSRKSGTLRVRGPKGDIQIVLRSGDIVGAMSNTPSLSAGQLLIKHQRIDAEGLARALRRQGEAGQARLPIVATLIEMGLISREHGYEVLRELIERTVQELVSWSRGTFDFDMDAPPAADDFRYMPPGIASGLDTQQVLIEALRILDERNRDDEAKRAAGPPAERAPSALEFETAETSFADVAFTDPGSAAPKLTPVVSVRAGVGSAPANPAGAVAVPGASAGGVPVPAASARDAATPGAGLASAVAAPVTTASAVPAPVPAAPSAPVPEPVPADPGEVDAAVGTLGPDAVTACPEVGRAILFTADPLMLQCAEAGLSIPNARVEVYQAEPDVFDAARRSTGAGLATVVVADLSGHAGALAEGRGTIIPGLRRCFPEVPVVAIVDSTVGKFRDAFRIGAYNVLSRPRRDVPDAAVRMRGFLTVLASCIERTFDEPQRLSDVVAHNRRQMAELRHRVQQMRDWKASPDISLTVLEYVAQYLERCVMFLVRRDDLLGLGAFGLSADGENMSAAAAKLRIPLNESSVFREIVTEGRVVRGAVQDAVLAKLHKVIGRPATGEVLIVPVMGDERPIALIYGDFGDNQALALQTDMLEIIAAVAGMSLQLSLWRRKRTGGK